MSEYKVNKNFIIILAIINSNFQNFILFFRAIQSHFCCKRIPSIRQNMDKVPSKKKYANYKHNHHWDIPAMFLLNTKLTNIHQSNNVLHAKIL